MRPLVLTPKFKRAFRKFVKRNADLQQRIEDTPLNKTRKRIVKLLSSSTSERMMRFINWVGSCGAITSRYMRTE